MPRANWWWKPCVAFVLGSLAGTMTGGCSGRMDCTFVSTNMARVAVEPTDAKVIRMDCQRCYWWVDQTGRLNIAGENEQKSLAGEAFDRRFLISIVPGEQSKGVGKNYRCNRNTVRGWVKTPGNVHRFKSVFGVVGLEHRDTERIVGAFRVNVAMQSGRFLGGWGAPAPYLLVGTFDAVKDEKLGQAIREQTEADGFERKWFDQSSLRRSGQVSTQPTMRRKPVAKSQTRPTTSQSAD